MENNNLKYVVWKNKKLLIIKDLIYKTLEIFWNLKNFKFLNFHFLILSFFNIFRI